MTTAGTIGLIILFTLLSLYVTILVALVIGRKIEQERGRRAFFTAWDNNEYTVSLKNLWNESSYVQIRFSDGHSIREILTDRVGVPQSNIYWAESDPKRQQPTRREKAALGEYTQQIVTMARLAGDLDRDQPDGMTSGASSGP